jgi:hypothetical protein
MKTFELYQRAYLKNQVWRTEPSSQPHRTQLEEDTTIKVTPPTLVRIVKTSQRAGQAGPDKEGNAGR